MPANYSLFEIGTPEFDLSAYQDDKEILELVLTKVFVHCTGCDTTSLMHWQIMARGERKTRRFWLTDAAGYLERFPTLPRRISEHTEEHRICVSCFDGEAPKPA